MFRRFSKLWSLLNGLYADTRVPGTSKVLFWFSVLYVLLPIDLVPDFIPLLGQLDDITIGPIALYIAWKWIEKKVREEHMRKWDVVDVEIKDVDQQNSKNQNTKTK